MTADDIDGPRVYGPATVQDNSAEAPHWVAHRRGDDNYPAGSFSTQLMDLYDAGTTSDEDRVAIGQWWPDGAATLDRKH